MDGFHRFIDPDGYPAIKPPWGTLNAIDMKTGKYLWKIPLGQYPELVAKGMPDTGSENFGGPIVTAGGLVFIGATIYDKKLRAFDSRTGKLLWEGDLPLLRRGDALNLHGERQAICRDRRRRCDLHGPLEDRQTIRRRIRSICPALTCTSHQRKLARRTKQWRDLLFILRSIEFGWKRYPFLCHPDRSVA